MIPDDINKIWEKGLNEYQYSLKLCGAGGGGFFLGFANNQSTILDLAQNYKVLTLDIL